MKTTQIPVIESNDSILSATEQLVREWISVAGTQKPNKSSRRLSGLLADPNGLAFAVGFIDGVIRPEDLRVAATNLYQIRGLTPKFLPLGLRMLLSLGANLAPLFPSIVVPIARKVLRGFVSHLILDARRSKLNKVTSKLALQSTTLNINLLGEAVLGKAEADRRLDSVKEILSRPETEYVSVKVSAIAPPHSPWAFDLAVAEIVERLTPLYQVAASAATPKFINLDMEEYKDLDLTIEVFKRILRKPEFIKLHAGIVLQAYLPDALRAMIDLQQWAQMRVVDGGAPIKIRVVKGANLPMERVDAEIHGWPLATVGSKEEADANYKRVLNYALTAERVKNIRIGVAGHNLFDLAFAWLLAKERGADSGMDVEMLLGMAPEQAAAVSATTGSLVLYTPVVYPKEFDVAIAYLIRRLEEGASSDNFLSNAFKLSDQSAFEIELERFRKSLIRIGGDAPVPNRLQDRGLDIAAAGFSEFSNAPDTDPATPANRDWAKKIYRRIATSTIGQDLVSQQTLDSAEELESAIERAKAAAAPWGKLPSKTRAELLHRVGVVLEQNREYLIEVAMSEAGKTFDQIDTEVSEAIDFAHYYANQALRLESLPGAIPVPRSITVVTPPWNFPIAIPAGGALAALATGSAVIFKPAPQAARCGAVLASLLLEVLPRDIFIPIQISESDLGSRLLTHKDVDQVILTGGYETAKLFKELRPELRLTAETSGKNAIIVTPHADLDLAAKDIAYSAFAHAGQKCSASSVVILVGSVAKSQRFRRQLIDAISSLKVDYPENPMAQIGPVIGKPEGKLLGGLMKLERGEKWLIEPKQLDDSGVLWSPGVRERVLPNSPSHKTEYFGPILAIMTARNLEAAIALQNAVDYGLTAGIHSLSRQEISDWLERVQAGNVYVNRGITGAIVQRQPFGGWKKSAVGPTAKAGGPNYLFTLTGWRRSDNKATEPIQGQGVNQLLSLAAMSNLSDDDLASLLRAAQSDAAALRDYFAMKRDPSALASEQNVLRYFRADCSIRIQGSASEYDCWRLLLSAVVLGGVKLSAASLPAGAAEILARAGVTLAQESFESWLERFSKTKGRVRIVGQYPTSALGDVDIAVYDGQPTESGIVDLLPFFKEQAVSITMHRFGNPALHVGGLSL